MLLLGDLSGICPFLISPHLLIATSKWPRTVYFNHDKLSAVLKIYHGLWFTSGYTHCPPIKNVLDPF